MKVTLERNHLLKSLGHVHRVVERRNTYPILANVLLKAADGKLDLRATDLDIEVTESVPAMVGTAGHDHGAGPHALRDRPQAHRRRRSPARDRRAASRCCSPPAARASTSPASRPTASPTSSPAPSATNSRCPPATLRELIERTQFAISNEETRYYLNGIYLHTLETGGEPMLRAVATDGHRMARAETDAPDGRQGHAGHHHPQEDRRRGAEAARWRRWRRRRSKCRTPRSASRSAAWCCSRKLIEGTFPDYERVTPKNNDKAMNVDRASFATAVDRVSTIASERGGKAVKLSVKDGQLELSVTNPDHGTASEELPVEFETESFEIGFNARYLLDIIGQIRSDNAVFLFNDAGSPTLVQRGRRHQGALCADADAGVRRSPSPLRREVDRSPAGER